MSCPDPWVPLTPDGKDVSSNMPTQFVETPLSKLVVVPQMPFSPGARPMTPKPSTSEIRQPDHPLPTLDLPQKVQRKTATDCPLHLTDALLTHFSQVHAVHEEIINRLVKNEKNMQLVLDHVTTDHKLGIRSQTNSKDTSPVPRVGNANHDNMRSTGEKPTGMWRQTSNSSVLGGLHRQISRTLKKRNSEGENSDDSSASPEEQFMKKKRLDMEQLNAIVEQHANNVFGNSLRKKAIWHFFENRHSGPLAYVYGSYLAPAIILISAWLSVFQTTENLELPAKTFSSIQAGFEILWAVEFMLRFLVCPDRYKFWLQVFNWIDFCSFSPIILRIYWLINDSEQTSIFAVVPILRLLKILRRFHKFHLLKEAIWLAVEALPVLTFAMVLIAMMFSSLIYLVEPRSLIPSLPDAFWFVILTMTTVGYGDVVPVTAEGKVVSMILMVASVLYMAMPIGIVGTIFSDVWGERDRLLLIAALRENFASSGISDRLFLDIFLIFADKQITDDVVDDPKLNLDQFRNMILALKVDLSDDRIAALFRSVHWEQHQQRQLLLL